MLTAYSGASAGAMGRQKNGTFQLYMRHGNSYLSGVLKRFRERNRSRTRTDSISVTYAEYTQPLPNRDRQ